jgi:hypothetical protein
MSDFTPWARPPASAATNASAASARFRRRECRTRLRAVLPRVISICIATLPSMSQPCQAKGTVPLADALSRRASLTGLLARVRESSSRLACLGEALPPALATQVRPGPVADTGRTLLVGSGAAAAAKLRQCLPRIRQALHAHGWSELPIR